MTVPVPTPAPRASCVYTGIKRTRGMNTVVRRKFSNVNRRRGELVRMYLIPSFRLVNAETRRAVEASRKGVFIGSSSNAIPK